ncbi:MAG: hypothetical protein Q9182_007123 [Xanthomendoza sp. 2 TL-2023]
MSDLLQFVLNQHDQIRRARLPSLFSDFTVQKYTNPDGYNANVNIWSEVLLRAARAGLVAGQDGVPQRLSLETGPYLSQQLESSEWGKPLALNAVIDEAISRHQMLPYHDFLTSSRSIYSRRLTELPWRFVAWGLNQMGMCRTFSRTDMQASADLVLIPNIEYIKFHSANEVFSPISEEDRAIASLRSLIEDTSKQIGALQTQIAAAREKSQKAVESKNRPTALAALRSKKSAESALSQRMDTLFQLEQIFISIKKASDQIALVGVMKNSAEVLRGLNAKVGSIHNVENALNCLKNEMEKVEDVATLVSEAGQETGADENEIDEEFDALLRQKERAEEEKASELTKQRLADLDGADGSGKVPSPDNGRPNQDRSQSVDAMLEC